MDDGSGPEVEEDDVVAEAVEQSLVLDHGVVGDEVEPHAELPVAHVGTVEHGAEEGQEDEGADHGPAVLRQRDEDLAEELVLADQVLLVLQFAQAGLNNPDDEDDREQHSSEELHEVECGRDELAVLGHLLQLLKLPFHHNALDVKGCDPVSEDPLFDEILLAVLHPEVFEVLGSLAQGEQVVQHFHLFELELVLQKLLGPDDVGPNVLVRQNCDSEPDCEEPDDPAEESLEGDDVGGEGVVVSQEEVGHDEADDDYGEVEGDLDRTPLSLLDKKLNRFSWLSSGE